MKGEKSLFLQMFGESPKLRVMDFLVTSYDCEYSMKEIAVKSGVGYSTLREFWPELVKNQIVIFTRNIGNAKMYKLNMKNPVVSQFNNLYQKVTEAITKQMHPKFKKKAIKEVK